jgi:cation transport ATPase
MIIADGMALRKGGSVARLSQDASLSDASQGLGITPILLSGDLEATAKRVAADVGIDKLFAEVSPEPKADYVKRLQVNGHVTGMVGDGVKRRSGARPG